MPTLLPFMFRSRRYCIFNGSVIDIPADALQQYSCSLLVDRTFGDKFNLAGRKTKGRHSVSGPFRDLSSSIRKQITHCAKKH